MSIALPHPSRAGTFRPSGKAYLRHSIASGRCERGRSLATELSSWSVKDAQSLTGEHAEQPDLEPSALAWLQHAQTSCTFSTVEAPPTLSRCRTPRSGPHRIPHTATGYLFRSAEQEHVFEPKSAAGSRP
jgi:hypothetical protein